MRIIRTVTCTAAIVLSFLSFATVAFCQIAPPPARSISLAGPRFGITTLSPGVVNSLASEEVFVKPVISQFGWQVERQFFATGSGLAVLNEWVGLLGGLDQGYAVPSVSWMVGVRSSEGLEFGLGPNVTPNGVALALAAGVTVRAGVVNVPLNVAIVPSQAGMRVSMLAGFTLRR
jgi:hypothetical protein